MRDYGTISPQFWIGKTGKALRGQPEAQLVALYLMTSPHATSIGIFHCPMVYIVHETGLPFEGASKGLRSLIDAGFCQYDEETEEVFVVNMATYQVAESLSPNDKRCVWVAKELEKVGSSLLSHGFSAIYSIAFNLPMPPAAVVDNSVKTSPFEGPSKPLRSQEQEQEQEQGQERDVPPSQIGSPASPSAQPPKNQKQVGSRIPDDWSLSESGRAFCGTERPDLDPDSIAAIFVDHWRTQPGKDGLSTDWEGTWRNWVRKERKASGTGRAVDVARITTPGPVGLDPELQKMDADARRAAPPPAYIRKQVDQLKTMGA